MNNLNLKSDEIIEFEKIVEEIYQIATNTLIGDEDLKRRIIVNYLNNYLTLNNYLPDQEGIDAIKIFFKIWKNSMRSISRFIPGDDISKQAAIDQYMTNFYRENERFPTLQDLAEMFRVFSTRKSWDRNIKVHNGRDADSGKLVKGHGRKKSRNKHKMIQSVTFRRVTRTQNKEQ